MTPHSSLRRARPLACGCIGGVGVPLKRCEVAERLYEEFRALGGLATSQTPEWEAYKQHFQKGSKR